MNSGGDSAVNSVCKELLSSLEFVGVQLQEHSATFVGVQLQEHGAIDVSVQLQEHGATDVGVQLQEHGAIDVSVQLQEHGATDVGVQLQEYGAAGVGVELREHRVVLVGVQSQEHGVIFGQEFKLVRRQLQLNWLTVLETEVNIQFLLVWIVMNEWMNEWMSLWCYASSMRKTIHNHLGPLLIVSVLLTLMHVWVYANVVETSVIRG